MYRHIIKYCSLLIIVFSMIGCAADNFSAEVEEEEVVPGDLVVSINVNLDGNGSSRSRAEADEVLPDTAYENRLSHGHLFLQNLKDDGNPVEGQPMYYVKVSLNKGENTFKLKNIDFGRKRVYIAANLSDEQARHFATTANAEYEIPLAMQGKGYGMTQEYARATDIAMFCTEGQILDFIENKLYVFDNPFTLKRLVAKVHVTATTTKTNDIEYCTLAAPMAGIGWIRLENVKYLINGLNTKSYLMQKYFTSSEDPNFSIPEDPNFNIENNIQVKDNNINPVNYQDFYFNSIKSVSDFESYFAKAEKYDASRIPTSNDNSVDNPYTEGLYCPENTFALPAGEILTAFNGYKSDAWPMVTHLIVSAKFTPKKIVVERSLADWVQSPDNISISEAIRMEIKNEITAADNLNDNFKSLCTILCSSEEVAKAVLLSSLKRENYLKEDDNSQGLPDETYFWNDSENLPMVFTYGAAKIFSRVSTNAEQFDQFATVPDGVGYYYIYLDNTDSNSTTGDGTRKDPANSIVERNAYYLVNIKSISGPGDATMKGDNILVNTVKTGWKVGGKAEVVLE
ncbi:hypothetical protein [Bacteroides caecigallinarum]|uniref:hypothetical protein n=1 Tax=Bacteroides caecigallinarum TaxID=1411144 RepID=UPI00195ED50E|nr:hypothetical protein [Bacteroides caecigallinarum]